MSAPGWVQQPTPPAATSSRPPWLIPVIAAVSAAVLVIAAFGAINLASGDSTSSSGGSQDGGNSSSIPATTTLDVALTVFDEDGCDFGWGYDDVPGSTVTVSVDGVPVAFDQLPRFGQDSVVFCDFKVAIRGVPTDGNIYEIEIGRRGKAVKSRAELIEENWSYNGTLGL
jgi:hypothetical protein